MKLSHWEVDLKLIFSINKKHQQTAKPVYAVSFVDYLCNLLNLHCSESPLLIVQKALSGGHTTF